MSPLTKLPQQIEAVLSGFHSAALLNLTLRLPISERHGQDRLNLLKFLWLPKQTSTVYCVIKPPVVIFDRSFLFLLLFCLFFSERNENQYP